MQQAYSHQSWEINPGFVTSWTTVQETEKNIRTVLNNCNGTFVDDDGREGVAEPVESLHFQQTRAYVAVYGNLKGTWTDSNDVISNACAFIHSWLPGIRVCRTQVSRDLGRLGVAKRKSGLEKHEYEFPDTFHRDRDHLYRT
jgi:hypothetical protein